MTPRLAFCSRTLILSRAAANETGRVAAELAVEKAVSKASLACRRNTRGRTQEPNRNRTR